MRLSYILLRKVLSVYNFSATCHFCNKFNPCVDKRYKVWCFLTFLIALTHHPGEELLLEAHGVLFVNYVLQWRDRLQMIRLLASRDRTIIIKKTQESHDYIHKVTVKLAFRSSGSSCRRFSCYPKIKATRILLLSRLGMGCTSISGLPPGM